MAADLGPSPSPAWATVIANASRKLAYDQMGTCPLTHWKSFLPVPSSRLARISRLNSESSLMLISSRVPSQGRWCQGTVLGLPNLSWQVRVRWPLLPSREKVKEPPSVALPPRAFQ